MSENRSYRINTNINKDNVVNVQISQDIDCLEILSLKINQVDTYRLQSANYGVIVGRVLANDGFGVPNVKVSVFIELDKVDKENPDITTIYPYTSMQTRDKDGRKYNLLLDNDNGNGDCYRIVGTFPNKRLVLDNENQLEVFDKYWKYTTVTNNAGDYMIFGVPVGVHTVHIDCDLSDIGILSQKPRDFYYKGYEKTNFENASQFKESTNLDDLVQIISQDKSIQVYPFWGDKDSADVIALSRCDLNLAYKFEPTCVFMGSVITDDYSNAIGHTCSPSKKVGYNNRLTTNRGTIEMIRKTPDGAVEEYQVQGNEVVDGDGVWCYQIPMNLDYIKTDEYGNIVPTDNPNEGIATRTRARFRLSIEETYNEGISRHRAKMLIPNNLEANVDPNGGGVKLKDDTEWEKCFQFGSRTPENQYRDLYWNKIYSVKSYIPRIQTNNNVKTHNYSAIRSVNLDTTNNPHPFNRIRLNVPFAYTILCVLLKIVFLLAFVLNGTVISLLNTLAEICIPPFKLKIFGKKLYWCVFEFLETDCISFTFPGAAPDGGDECYVPGCWNKAKGQGSCSTNYKRLTDRLEQALAQEYNVVNLDFYNDWVNGTVYMPLWFWKKTKKKKYLFGLFRKKAVNTFCNCSRNFQKTRIFETCALEKTAKFKPKNGNSKNPDKTKNSFLFRYGIIKEFQNKDGLNVYYYAPGVRNEYGQYGRLYSTDLILLGSFMDCDLDGITNICDKLPSTTANIPFLSTIREQPEDGGDDSFSDIVPGGDSVDGATADDADGSTEENAVLNQSVEITGMDWTYKGKDSNPTYKDGLFFDIGCGKTETRTKTCINLGRMSELGVSLDSGYYIKYPSGNGFKEKYIEPDGMILRHELDDIDTRAAFATMNHGRLVGGVENSNTKYKSYLLYYTYPMNFDGAMDSAIRAYGVDFEDYQDESYVKFRYGLDVKSDRNLNIKDAVRYNDSFLLTNNSFYFYFGLHPGKTAIEKYQELYNANCSNNKKYTQTYDIIATNSSSCNNDGNITIDFSYIRPPYTITMTYINDEGNETIVKFKKESTNGSTIYNSNILPKCPTTNSDESEYEDKIESEELKIIISGLTNNDYTLKIVDVNGREVTEFVELNPPIVSINDVVGQQVDIKYIPNSDKKVNGGNIFLGEWVYEGVAITPTMITPTSGASAYTITVKTTTSEEKKFELRISFKSMYPKDNTEWEISDCIQSVSIIDNKVKFDINIPGYYEFEIQRLCDCNQTLDDGICNQILDDGILFERVFVPNNIQFQLRLNGTPVDAIVSGWTTEWGNADDSEYPFNVHVADTYYNSDLVPTNIINEVPDYKMVTWNGISYLTKDNILLWKDYISGLINMGDDSTFWEGQTTNITRNIRNLIDKKNRLEGQLAQNKANQLVIDSKIKAINSQIKKKEEYANGISSNLELKNQLSEEITRLRNNINDIDGKLLDLQNGVLKEYMLLKTIESGYIIEVEKLKNDWKDNPNDEELNERLQKAKQELADVQVQIQLEEIKEGVFKAITEYNALKLEKSALENDLKSIEERYNEISGYTQDQLDDLEREIQGLKNQIGDEKDEPCDPETGGCTLYGYYNYLHEENNKLTTQISELATQITNEENELAKLKDFDSKIESLQNKIGNENDEACEEGGENCSLYGQLNKLNQDAANGDDKSSKIEAVKKQIAEKEKELAEAKELKAAYEEFKTEQDKIVRHNLYLILEFRLKCILQMSKGMYTYFGASAPSFKLTTAGGENPCVICSEYPDYGECNIPEDDLLERPKKATMKQVIHSPSISRIQGQSSFPTIVPKNYGVVIDANTKFVTYQNNRLYNSLILEGDTSIGNYVAAFDNNMEKPYHTQPTSGSPSPSGFTDMTETTHPTIQSGDTANFCKTHFIDTSIDYVFTVISPLTKECMIKGVNDDVKWGTGCVYGNIIGGVKMKTQEEQLISTASADSGKTFTTEYAYEINTDKKFVKLSSVPIDDSGKTFCKCEIYVKNNNPEDKSNPTLKLNPEDASIFTQNYDGWGITNKEGLKKSTLLKRDGHKYFSKETYPEITCVGCDKIPSGVTNVSVNISSYSYDISPELQYDESGYASGITLNASMGEECDVELIGENSLGLSIVFGSIVRYNFPSSSSDERKVQAIDCRFKLNPNMSGKSYTKQLIGCRMTTSANTKFDSDEGYLNWNDGYFSGGTLDSKIAGWDTLTSWADSAPFRLSYKGENTEYVNGYLRDKESKKYLDDSYIDGNFVLQTSDISDNVNSFAIFCKNTRFGGELSSGDLHLKQITQYQVLKTLDVRSFKLTTHKSGDYITGGTITPKYDILSIDDDAIKFSSEVTEIKVTTSSGNAAYLYDHIKVYTSTDITNEDNILDKEFYNITANIKKEENTETYYITKIKLEFVVSTIAVPEDSGTTCYSFKGLKPDDSFLDLKNPKVFIGITCSNQLTYMFRWDDWKLARTKIDCPSDTATNN